MAHETVSRALTALAHSGCIGVSHRDIEIIDEAALRELQRVTRGRSPHEAHEQAHSHSRAHARVHALAA